MSEAEEDIGRSLPMSLWAVLPALLGTVLGGMALGLRPDRGAGLAMDALPIPPYALVAIWIAIYGGMGLAARTLWLARRDCSVAVALTLLAVGYGQSLSFWLSDGVRAVAMVDAIGLLIAAVAVLVVRAVAPSAVGYLVPWVVWMPVTLGFKIAAIAV